MVEHFTFLDDFNNIWIIQVVTVRHFKSIMVVHIRRRSVW